MLRATSRIIMYSIDKMHLSTDNCCSKTNCALSPQAWIELCRLSARNWKGSATVRQMQLKNLQQNWWLDSEAVSCQGTSCGWQHSCNGFGEQPHKSDTHSHSITSRGVCKRLICTNTWKRSGEQSVLHRRIRTKGRLKPCWRVVRSSHVSIDCVQLSS